MSKKHCDNSHHIYGYYDLKELFIETDEFFFVLFFRRHDNYSPFLLMEKQYTLLMSLLVKAPT